MPDAHPNPSPSAAGVHHARHLPLRVGTRGSPLALRQTHLFLELLTRFCPVLALGVHGQPVFEQHVIRTTGDRVQDRSLAEIGGKGLFSKEIHEALLDGRIDFAVHSLKDLETELPPGIVLACTLKREDARDALILGPGCLVGADEAGVDEAGAGLAGAGLAVLPPGAVIGTNSLRRAAQLRHARPDLRTVLLRGNVQPRIEKVLRGDCTASLLAVAGIRRLGLQGVPMVVLDPAVMVPSAGQGIVGITVRAADGPLHGLLSGIEDPEARAVSTAERSMLAALDGNCRTPIGGYARLLPGGRDGGPQLHLTGLVARADGSFLLRRSLHGAAEDAARIGAALGAGLRADSPGTSLADARVPDEGAGAGAGAGRDGVLITRARDEAVRTAERVQALGFSPVVAPLLRVRARRLRWPDGCATVVVTSGNALACLSGREGTVFAVGDATAARARAMGLREVHSASGDAADLVALVRRHCAAGTALLLVTGTGVGHSLTERLRESGFRVHRRVGYTAQGVARLPAAAAAALAGSRLRAALFLSAETARTFARVMPPSLLPSLHRVDALAIGQPAAAALALLPWRRVRVSVGPSLEQVLALL